VAEVINNAEDHSGTNVWYVAAYLRQLEGLDFGDCHIVVVFNLGRSIATTMRGLPHGCFLGRQIGELIRAHQDAGHFRTGYTQEALHVCAPFSLDEPCSTPVPISSSLMTAVNHREGMAPSE
jgi:hypothetical protein